MLFARKKVVCVQTLLLILHFGGTHFSEAVDNSTSEVEIPPDLTSQNFVNRTTEEDEAIDNKRNDNRTGRDLVYESMKMRSGNWKPRSPDDQITVGGGIVEKKLLMMNPLVSDTNYADEDIESREMQCCDEVTVESFGGILECHPYVLGEYRRIGQCGGRSFYQHKNNTDIFIYYVCGAWYVGLQVGVCGGWILAKSQEICVSARHKTHWQFFNEGQLFEDDTFHVGEKCQFNEDFPAFVPTAPPANWVGDVSEFPHFSGNGALGETIQQSTTSNFPSSSLGSGSVKHEHVHYHYEQEKPPPVTSAKSNKLENLKRYQQQVFQNRQGSSPSQPGSVANPVYPVAKPVYASSTPVYAGQLVTKSSLYGRPSGPTGYATQYETEFVRSKPVFVARDRMSSGGYSSAQHFYREEPDPEENEGNSYFPVGNGRKDGLPKVTRILEEEDDKIEDNDNDGEKIDERTKHNSRKMKK